MQNKDIFADFSEKRIVKAAWLIIIASTLVRVWFILFGGTDLFTDEAQYWDWSRTLQLSYYSKGPLIAYFIRFWTAIFGDTELGVRIGACVNTLIMQVLIFYFLARVWKRPRTALLGLIVANTMPVFLATGILMTTDNLLMLFWLAALITLYKLALKPCPGKFLLLGLFVAAGTLAKYTMLLFIPLALIYLFLLLRREKTPAGLWPGTLISLFAGAILGSLPIVLWNMQTGWAGIKHVLYRGGMAGEDASVLFAPKYFFEFLGGQIGIISPWWFAFLIAAGVLTLISLYGKKENKLGLDRNQSILLSVFFWPVWIFFLLWSLRAKVEPNWPAVSFCAGIILATLGLEMVSRRQKKIWISLGLVLFCLTYSLGHLPLPRDMDPATRLRGWEKAGEKAGELRKNRFPDPGRVFFLSDTYGPTSALSFYVPGQDRAFCVNTGRKLNQYDFWPPPTDKTGWNAVYMEWDEEHSAPEELKNMFCGVKGPIIVNTGKAGKSGVTVTFFLCYDYNGFWPDPEHETF